MITRTSTLFLQRITDLSDHAAWEQFDQRYRPILMSVGRRLGLGVVDAEDAAQETLAAFLVDYRAGRYKREMGRLRDWLAGIMAHKVRDSQRRTQRHSALIGAAATSPPVESIEDKSVELAMQKEWLAAALRQTLDLVRQECTPEMFESFELFALQQWPAAQVAKRLGISADSVYQNKRRVLLRIRELLPQAEEAW